MKAVQIVEPERPLVLRELPRPEPGSGEVRVRVEAAGVCHSDVHYRDGVAAEVAAVMMCSTATVFHALRRARAAAGDRVAVFGAGGLGLSAVQLARIGGAARVYAVDIDREKLDAAARLGAVPVDPADGLPQEQIHALTDGRGVDIALECAGLALTQQQALASLGVHGRLALVGITNELF